MRYSSTFKQQHGHVLIIFHLSYCIHSFIYSLLIGMVCVFFFAAEKKVTGVISEITEIGQSFFSLFPTGFFKLSKKNIIFLPKYN